MNLLILATRTVEFGDAVLVSLFIGVVCFAAGLACSKSTYDDGEGN